MCLELKGLAFKRIATKNIIVYKQLSSYEVNGVIKYVTPYQKSEIVIGETYKSELKRYNNRIEVGLHSFVTISDCFDNSCHIGSIVWVNGNRTVKPVLVECIIPIGARYYKGVFDGKYKSLASDTLVYNRILGFNK